MFSLLFSTVLYIVLSMFLNPILQDYGVVKYMQKAIILSALTFIITMPVSWAYDKITAPDEADKTALSQKGDMDTSSLAALAGVGSPEGKKYENIPNDQLTPAQRHAKAEARELDEAMKNLKAYQSMQ